VNGPGLPVQGTWQGSLECAESLVQDVFGLTSGGHGRIAADRRN